MLIAHTVSHLVRTIMNMHLVLSKPLTKAAVLALCRLTELLKVNFCQELSVPFLCRNSGCAFTVIQALSSNWFGFSCLTLCLRSINTKLCKILPVTVTGRERSCLIELVSRL